MKKLFLRITLAAAAATLLFSLLYLAAGQNWAESFAISFGCILYHFAMRLAVGYRLDARFHNQLDPGRPWFQPRPWEARLYKKLQVQRWKKWIPSFVPESFRLERDRLPQLIGATCQAELVHELIIMLSLLPIAFSAWLGAFWVFLLTSLLAAAIDGVFVILQRYNRPRILHLLERLTEKSQGIRPRKAEAQPIGKQ